ncbi:MAG TPA: HDIG domain-containing protein [Candidatus Limnocylindria bacterium]|nr:HDIG domain-containing protein [Candidatus Limnocylindria bacterium]
MIRLPAGRRIDQLPTALRDAFGARKARMYVFVVLTGILTSVALLLSPPATVGYDVGTLADRTVKAPRSVAFVSETLTEAERERAVAAVPKVYTRNQAVVASSRDRLAQAVAAIGRVRADATTSREQRITALTRLTEATITPQLAPLVVDITAAEWDALSKEVDNALRTLYQPGIRPEQLEAARAAAATSLPPAWTDRQKAVGAELVRQFLDSDVALDPIKTASDQQTARSAVQPVQVQVVAGEVVVREATVVSQQDVEKLRALGLVNTGIDWPGAVGLTIWAVLIAAVLALFVERYATEAWNEDRKIILVALSLLAVTVTARALVPGHTLLVYFLPFAAVAMILTVLVGGRTALATQIAGALHVGIMSGQVELVAYVLVPALLGMAAVQRATTAREFATGALAVAIGNLGVVVSFSLVGQSTDPVGAAQLAVAALVSGAGSGLLAFAGMAIFGHLFRITTVFELRELADPNHPLLRQLLLRTPGTYHHSLLVANLAERAAEVIGADPLVARVGAYYHDIGKMRNPSAFIENQTGTNPHDELDPMVSAGIVAAHVRDGLWLADRHRLPPMIREMIPAHHGTAVVKYFYQLAQQRGQNPDESTFHYPGPRPRTKEAGIVMLADGTEASVRSLAEKKPETIRAMVEKIVGERLAEGQLDDCDLTLRDLQQIKNAFCELLLGVYHERIPYPEDRIAQIPPAPRAASDR